MSTLPTRIRKLIIQVRSSKNPANVYDNETIKELAVLQEHEYALAEQKLKKILGQALNLNRLTKAVNEIKRSKTVPDQTGKPAVIVNLGQLPEITAQCLDALAKKNNPPRLFKSRASLVKVVTSGEIPKLQVLGIDHLRGELTRAASFYKRMNRGFKTALPPNEVMRDILTLENLPFLELQGIVECPVLKQDGSILATRGYDEDTGLWYEPSKEFKISEIPDEPSSEDLRKAIKRLKKLLRQFALPSTESRANALALMLTPIVRPVIIGPVPMAIIDAPEKGTGKSNLANTVALIATGREATLFVTPEDGAEWRKKITTTLKDGATIILVDDVDILDSAHLSTVLTSSVWEDRILGLLMPVKLPHRAIWMAAGNNIRVRDDLQRRCFWIRMDAQVAEPWRRKHFEVPNLMEWVKSKREKFLVALLTIARAWYVAGKHMADVPPFGSFEEWSRIIGGILKHAGISGFLKDLDKYRYKREEETLQWERFLKKWSKKYRKPIPVHELCKDVRNWRECLPGELIEALDSPNKSFERVLGKALAKKEDVRFGKLQLKRAGLKSRAILWKVSRN